MVNGIQGYERSVEQFVSSSQQLNFLETNQDFLPFLPPAPARVLDLGAGAGQNSAALANMGFHVLAIEPMPDFLQSAQRTYAGLGIEWRQDSMPQLSSLLGLDNTFEFILADGVWHHLSDEERSLTFERLATVMANGAKLALSLRNGPPGLGARVFPTDVRRTIAQAEAHGLRCIFRIENQRSIYRNKPDVRWARVALEKRPNAKTIT
ncbi:class I SAM-dependent methyltransferase [Cerasicoccus maritimus]|uniref:class I SAM-dependent methyltransferase n=1 Tax=Cerasicoccus maritimus TaxID=490089 RepID=UPI002852680A|nr:class I SAM-dependent methyltransferase [Cerasicoccus maritimus]